ncbi:hypothetical protein CJ030_MR6G000782 [Morella rubra]|uniref:Receptor-like protein 12 n=1 Tax=Morella rubra TaxID=262757 RepID=A0A6A1V7X9_9ROSI|nr:hypothetical protein CJ030_MR6G000782 [Morella rubra]
MSGHSRIGWASVAVVSFVTSVAVVSFVKLEVLVLDRNYLNDSFLSSISAVASLKELHMEGNMLDQLNSLPEKLPSESWNYDFPRCIDRGCTLNGSLPAQGWCELRNLQELDLSGNELEEILPSCLANMTTLRLLDLSSNHFSGSMTLLSSFFNLSKLEVILSDNNEIVDEAESQTWAPTFQLKFISLSGSSLEKSSGTIPKFLHYQHKLQVIDLSHNNLSGKFPTWLLENNSRLEILNLRNNSFIGPFHVPYHPYPKIWSIDISHNHLGGQIPVNLGLVFPNLGHLNMSGYAFKGIIPSSFGDLVSLRTLDLSSNHLSGTMPKQFAMSCSSLGYVRLSNNNFSGKIFPIGFNLTNLSFLYIDNNQFSGKIPNSLPDIQSWAFDFSNNYFSGELLRWMGNMSSLQEIAMASKKLGGPIPHSFDLVTLDLRENRLTGYLPDWIGNLSSLSILLLKANHLQGKIQNQLCLLACLRMLDLFQNNFYGLIPQCLSNITFEGTHQKSDIVDETWLVDDYVPIETLLPY